MIADLKMAVVPLRYMIELPVKIFLFRDERDILMVWRDILN
jgi:hypothetical protein